jgi:signal transduction histidine kinase
MQTTFETSPDFGRIRRETELSLFRILQESLTNAHRHSGGATAQVRLVRNDGIVTLGVSDCGRGMPAASLEAFHNDLPASLGMGLRGHARANHSAGRQVARRLKRPRNHGEGNPAVR